MIAPFLSATPTAALGRFFAYARERYWALVRRRAGEPAPWSPNPILQEHRFCNVFREDDRTTAWFRERVRGPLSERPEVLLATVVFRWFNRIETGEALLAAGLFDSWDSRRARAALSGRSPLVTGSFMIKTPPGLNKLEGLLQCIEEVARCSGNLLAAIQSEQPRRLQYAWTLLTAFPYLGSFMSYEVVTDLRHTALLRDAVDINTFAVAGPGAKRGAERVLGIALPSYSSPGGANACRQLMIDLLELSRSPENWPANWPPWELREVEHTLCEFDKYERIRLGEAKHLKRRFAPSAEPVP